MTELEKSIKILTEHTQYYVPTEDLEHLYRVIEMAEKLAKYEAAEEEGRLKVFPLKVGDYIWDNDFGFPCAYKITGFSFGNLNADYESCNSSRYGLIMWYRNSDGSVQESCTVEEIGKTKFLTKEDAKKTLK